MVKQYKSNQEKVMKVKYMSDNMELVKREREHKTYEKSYAKTTLRAEYDLTEQTYMTNQENKIQAQYSWVKGYQDNTKSSEKLSLLAQLNVEADELAGKFQANHGQYCPRVPVFPASRAMLAIRGVSITSNYKHHLQRAFTEPRYIEHLQNFF